MGEHGFRVQPEALRAYAAVIRGQAEQITQIRSRLASVRLTSTDFGKLPGSQDLFGAYQEHAEAEQQNFADLQDILLDTADGLRFSAENYEEHEAAVADGYGGTR
ncbi:WXG100 family type VII secretion target [Kitasatospora sp. NBC_01539]|uniref:WXG100 family type VII secretion target n=1 Tax=Kitasatospora sp. NBC_01539 TaxID=2903577 RepID=UPI0038600E19